MAVIFWLETINWKRPDTLSNSESKRNTSNLSKNKSGYRGVSLHNGKWRARIMVNGVQTIIGVYNTPEEASIAYINYKKTL